MALSDIAHVVVLMLENRSFDCLLGRYADDTATFDGLSLAESNPDPDGLPVPVWNSGATDQVSMSIPDPDPGELFVDMNTQLFGGPRVPTPAPVPGMQDFVRNYASQRGKPGEVFAGKQVMHYFTPVQVPVLTGLAKQFAVCDRWHAAAPCQTWPNRFFAHTGTANGYENNNPPHFLYEMDTVFNQLEDAGRRWRIYFHDFPQSLTLAKLWPYFDHFKFYEEFKSDAAAGRLPAYAFIEPRYFADLELPNDQHPPHNVTLGEQLIADVYNTLRAGPDWERTLLIITYDEHGGCFDHVPPPNAVPPSATATSPFNFDRYGVRVPAVIISPYIAPNTVLRPAEATPFDHTSIIATLRALFPISANRSATARPAPRTSVRR